MRAGHLHAKTWAHSERMTLFLLMTLVTLVVVSLALYTLTSEDRGPEPRERRPAHLRPGERGGLAVAGGRLTGQYCPDGIVRLCGAGCLQAWPDDQEEQEHAEAHQKARGLPDPEGRLPARDCRMSLGTAGSVAAFLTF